MGELVPIGTEHEDVAERSEGTKMNPARRNPREVSGTSKASSSSAQSSANAAAADVGLDGMKAVTACLCNINYMFGIYATKNDKYTCLIIIHMERRAGLWREGLSFHV